MHSFPMPPISRGSRIVALVAALVGHPALPASAQTPPPRAPGTPAAVTAKVFEDGSLAIPAFRFGESPLALSGPARPGAYLSAVGRRAIAMGTEDGRLELAFGSLPIAAHRFPKPSHTQAPIAELGI